MAHGNAIGHGDGGKFARRAVGFLDTHLGRLRLPVERDIARSGLIPAGGNADQWLVNFFLAHPHGIVIRPVRRARRAFGYIPAGELGFVKFCHGGLLKKSSIPV